jgi:hypothetical protein
MAEVIEGTVDANLLCVIVLEDVISGQVKMKALPEMERGRYAIIDEQVYK